MKIDIQTEKPSYHQGDQVKGELVIAADEKGLSGDSVTLKLNEYWFDSNVQYAGKEWKDTKLDEAVLQRSFDFPAGTEHRFPFTLQLTKNCRITRLAENGKGHEKCGFEVELEGVKRKDRKHEISLEVLPGKEFLAIIETCLKKYQMKEREPTEAIRWTGERNPHKIDFWFTFSNPRSVGLRILMFKLLQTDDGGVAGKVDFGLDPSMAKGLWQRFWAIFKIGPGATKQFRLTAKQLFLSDGTTNVSSISKSIEDSIESVISSRSRRAF